MSLSDSQRSSARHDGGKDIANRKRFIAQVETGLRNLRDECEKSGALRGVLTPDEIKALARVAVIVGKVAAHLDADAREAKRIKADWDKRLNDAVAELGKLPRTSIDDIVVLAAMANHPRPPIGRYDLDYIRANPQRLKAEMETISRDATSSLAHACANDAAIPATRRNAILIGMAAWKDKHADLIRELNAIAVAAQLEKNA